MKQFKLLYYADYWDQNNSKLSWVHACANSPSPSVGQVNVKDEVVVIYMPFVYQELLEEAKAATSSLNSWVYLGCSMGFVDFRLPGDMHELAYGEQIVQMCGIMLVEPWFSLFRKL